MTIDGVFLSVLNNYFRAAAEAAGYTLERTAYTTFIKESQDFTTGLITPGGQQFAYPVAIGAQSYVGIDFSTFIESGAPWQEGDVLIANCPFATKGVSTHLPDYHLLRPIFVEGELMAFGWAFIHASDMGGIVAGSIQPSAYEIFQEGIRITPKKLYRAGELQKDVADFLLSNVRIPDKNWGDLNAVIAALGISAGRVQAAVEKWGIDAVREGREALIEYAERRAREIIRTLPDETWCFEDFLEDDYVSNVPVRIKLQVSKDGPDGLHFDFTGSDPQVQAAFNLATNGRHPFLCNAMFGFFRTREHGLPINGGLIRPFRFTAPEGTVVNAQFPAATGVRYALTQLIYTIVQGVLAGAFPGKIPAAGAGQATIPAIATVDPRTSRRQVVVIQPMIGGSGGRPWGDGIEGVDYSLGSLRNTPCEVLEHEAGVRVQRYQVIPDSGGAGKFRGGSALRLDVKLLHPNTVFTARGMERTKFQPWGLHGGRAGNTADCIINPEADAPRYLTKVNAETLSAGDVISLRTPGGGGYGLPSERDPQKVLQDVLDGFVTEKAARDVYGVVVAEGVLDEKGTKTTRGSNDVAESDDLFDFGDARGAYFRRYSSSVLDELYDLLQALPLHVRYRAKQLAMQALAKQFGDDATPNGWLTANWSGIESKLYGLSA